MISLISFILPVLINIYAALVAFDAFYGWEYFYPMLFTLAVCSLLFGIALSPVQRIVLCITPFLVLYCFLYNFIFASFLAVVIVFILLFLMIYAPRRIKSKFIFTPDNSAVFIRRKKINAVKAAFFKSSAAAFLSFLLLFGLTCQITLPCVLWQAKAFPVNLQKSEIYSAFAVPSGEITCTACYDKAAIMVEELMDVKTINSVSSPAKEAGIMVGDIITKFDGCAAKTSPFLQNESGGKSVTVDVVRITNDGDSRLLTFNVQPVYSKEEGKYMIGISYYPDRIIPLYSSVQTISFTYPDMGYFAATAHGVELDAAGSEQLLRILTSADIIGRDNNGITAEPNEHIGVIFVNNDYGSYGIWEKTDGELYPIAEKSEVRFGKAKLLSNLEGNGVNEYDIYITGTYIIGTRDVICFKVTDKRLIALGGIVRGMSGSPLIQNGKIIGALSNTDTKGGFSYATFAHDMAHELLTAKPILDNGGTDNDLGEE